MVGYMTLDYVLRDHGFTAGLTQTQLAKLASLASEVIFEENEVILADGQRSESLLPRFDGQRIGRVAHTLL